MSLPILQTKLYAPRLHRQNNIVSRPRLKGLLMAGLVGKLTLISAPAGFGKSTLLSEWIDDLGSGISGLELASTEETVHSQHPIPKFCWLTLDGDDNDPVRFLMHLTASLQKFDSQVGQSAWPLLQSPGGLPGGSAPKTILTILLNDLSRLVGEHSQPQYPYILVLEDYHAITAQPIHAIVTYLIDHAPPHLHVIITTRADPPLPFPRWRARDQLSELRAADLRFTADEAAAFLNDRMALRLSNDEVMAMEMRTEGWIAGLQLVALSLRGRANKAEFLRTFSGGHRYVLNYLVEEVLNQQTRAVQEFLLHTSILERLCGSLCDAVIGHSPLVIHTATGNQLFASNDDGQLTHDQSHFMLEQLEQANLFLTPLDDEGQWYRYHPLFAEVLQHRLRQTEPEALPALHRRASVWYEEQGLLADAINHSWLAADVTRTVELIERVWQVMWNQGAVATLLHWVHLLPEGALNAHPSLSVSYAWALALAGQIEAAEAVLRLVETALQVAAPDSVLAISTADTMLGRAAALRAMIAARRGEPAQAIQLAQIALSQIPVDETLLRGNAYYALGLADQQRGALPEASAAFQEASRLSSAAGDTFLMIAARYHQARVWMMLGQLRMAAETYQQVLALATETGKRLPVVGLAHVGYAEILYQWNKLATAADQVETGLALSPSSSLTYTDGPLHRFSVLARIRQVMGDREGAWAAIHIAKETAQQTGIALDEEQAAALAALIHLRLGQLEEASQWAQHGAYLLADEEPCTYIHEFATLVLARVLLAQQHPDNVLSLLSNWLPAAEAAQRIASVIEMCVLQALAFRFSDQPEMAAESLMRALSLAEPEGYSRIFVDEGEPMRLLLSEVASWIVDKSPSPQLNRLSPYIEQLLAAFDPVGVAEIGPSNPHPPSIQMLKRQISNLVEPLTDRELEVLHLIAAGLSNATIAEQLVVTVGTVKSHLKHIYGKLSVRSRTQAVAQARD
jgi:LuxR family maltose regulon positive regulatory protein